MEEKNEDKDALTIKVIEEHYDEYIFIGKCKDGSGVNVAGNGVHNELTDLIEAMMENERLNNAFMSALVSHLKKGARSAMENHMKPSKVYKTNMN